MDEKSKFKNTNTPLSESNEINTHYKEKEKHNDTDNKNCECSAPSKPPLPPKHPKPPKPLLPPEHPKPPKPPLPNTDSCSCCDDDIDITYSKCELIKTETKEVTLNCTGRLLEVNVVLKNVCPDKFVNVGVLVYEKNKLLSLKTCKLPTGSGDCCIQSLNAGKFCFVFDEESCPRSRTFNIKIIANYIKNPHANHHSSKDHC